MKPSKQVQTFFAQALYLHHQWTAFEELFMQTNNSKYPSNILLEGPTKYLFEAVKLALINDIIITIARFTDPKEQGNNKNLTVEYLVDSVTKTIKNRKNGKSEEGQEKPISYLEYHHSRLKKMVPKIRVFRNKALAHLDLDTAVGKEQLPLSRLHTIQKAVEEICRIAEVGQCLETNSLTPIHSNGVREAVSWCRKMCAFSIEQYSRDPCFRRVWAASINKSKGAAHKT